MKRRIISILAVCCIMVTMMPAAFATNTTMSEEVFKNEIASGTVNMTGDVTLTSPARIENGVTINGNGFSVNGSVSNGLLCVDTDQTVTINGLTLNGSVGIDVVSASPNISISGSEINATSRGIRYYDEDSTDNIPASFSNSTLTLNNTTIQNTLKPADKTYENWSHQGDSRGISLWNVKSSTVEIIESEILGFGYPINMAGDVVGGVRDMNNSTINITNSNVWGWCALNIWTIDTTFNITNSSLKGFVETDNTWNSFATIVLNEGIYGNVTSSDKANVFNITGGSVSSTCVSTNENVFHCLFRLDKEFMSEFKFMKSGRTPVTLYCNEPYSAFVATYDGMEMTDFENWASTKLTGASANTTYNWGAIAPGVDAPTGAATLTQIAENNVENIAGAGHEGGQAQ